MIWRQTEVPNVVHTFHFSRNKLCGLITDNIYPNSCIRLLTVKFVCYVTTICVKLVNLIYQNGNALASLNSVE